MKLKRLADLPRNLYAKYRQRQYNGMMKEYIDEQGYICYDQEEVDNYKPRKVGRPAKIRED